MVPETDRQHGRPMRIFLQQPAPALGRVVQVDGFIPRGDQEAERCGRELKRGDGVAGRGEELILCFKWKES